MTTTETYNGWTNYETWNIALWIGSDEIHYNTVLSILKSDPETNYQTIANMFQVNGFDHTPDGVNYNDENLNIVELDNMIKDFREGHNL